jgi:hypothetical protein
MYLLGATFLVIFGLSLSKSLKIAPLFLRFFPKNAQKFLKKTWQVYKLF